MTPLTIAGYLLACAGGLLIAWEGWKAFRPAKPKRKYTIYLGKDLL